MKNDTINYKFAFITIIIAHIVAEVFLVYFKPDAVRYAPLLQYLFFIVPVIIITENNFISQYKINFKFPINTIPAIFWILVGINLIEIGFDIVVRTALPTFVVDFYNIMLKIYNEEVNILLLNNSNTLLEFAIISFCFAVTPAVCEEILFRGYLMQNIERRNSIIKSIIFSAIIFSLIHFNVVVLIPIFIVGLCLGYLFYYTGSIIPSVILHFVNNFFAILSNNYYYGDSITINNITFGVVSLLIGIVILLIAFKTLKRKKNQYITKKV